MTELKIRAINWDLSIFCVCLKGLCYYREKQKHNYVGGGRRFFFGVVSEGMEKKKREKICFKFN